MPSFRDLQRKKQAEAFGQPVDRVRSVDRKFYSTSRWRRLRLVILNRDPICKVCGCAASEHVDHIKPRRSFIDMREADHPNNLQGLCHSCHSKKTKEEQNGA